MLRLIGTPQIATDIFEHNFNSFSSFYSSQGRQTSFPDQNSDLLEILQSKAPNVATLEVRSSPRSSIRLQGAQILL
jgi:hypothetical protein